jgi:hypothetical protein
MSEGLLLLGFQGPLNVIATREKWKTQWRSWTNFGQLLEALEGAQKDESKEFHRLLRPGVYFGQFPEKQVSKP